MWWWPKAFIYLGGAAAIAGGAYWYQNPYFWQWQWRSQPQQPVYCTQDVKQCPDGSYVGRVPPRCEFKECAVMQGIIFGRVTIGPLCPVEPCNTNYNPYIGRHIVLQAQNNWYGYSQPIYINLQADGTFRSSVRTGTYTLTLNPCNEMGCRYAIPRTVTINSNVETTINLNIDTGIR